MEGHELIHRLQNGGTLPMITSCSQVDQVCEHFCPELLDHLSTCKYRNKALALAKPIMPKKRY